MKIVILYMFCIAFLCDIVYAQHLPVQKKFILNGNIKGQASGNVFIICFKDGKMRKDSVALMNGNFTYHDTIAEPTQVYLSLNKEGNAEQRNNAVTVFIEPGIMTIKLRKDHFDEAVMTGSETQKENEELHQSKETVNKELAPLASAYDKANLAYIAVMKRTKNEDSLQYYLDRATEAKDAMEPVMEKIRAIESKFINEHPTSYVTASMMRYKISGMTVQQIQSVYDKMPREMQQGRYGVVIRKSLDNLKRGSPGAKAFRFSTIDIHGAPLSLADFEGKYVLLDFWASWCVPCRKGNPHLIELFRRYKDRGFEIIGIADDDSKPEAWRRAIAKDGIGIWKHVLRGYVRRIQGKESPVNKDLSGHYGIHTLPTKILIDPEGMIIGRYGGGGEGDEAMDQKMKEVFQYEKIQKQKK